MLLPQTAWLAFATLLVVVSGSLHQCRQPQRSGIFSLDTLANRDHITNLFHNITSQLKKFNATTTIQGQQYQIFNFTASLYYNDYAQVETIEEPDSYHVRVQSGTLHAAFHCNYSYGSGSRGNLGGRVDADQFTFVKGLKLTDGGLDWYPTELHDIVFSQFRVLDSQPKLPDDERKRFENMLNNNTAEDVPLRAEFIGEVNRLYGELLKDSLNNEMLLNNTSFNYTWKGKNVTYLNLVDNFTLSNVGFQGLTYKMIFEVDNFQNRCSILPATFNESYGGLQEYIGMETVYSTVLFALKEGWLNTQLDRSWQSDIFQFYSGDVANFIEAAAQRIPNEAVTGECHWNNSEFDLTLTNFNDKVLYLSIPYSCTLAAGSTKLQTMYFSLNLEVQLTLRSSQLDTQVILVGVVRPTFYPEGEYRVTNSMLAAKYIQSVAQTMIGRAAFGSGFPATQRDYPQILVTRDYLHLYDPSEK